MKLRLYQEIAIAAVREHWAAGVLAVCLVAPTGAGKTVLGEELITGDTRVLWVAHTRELVIQTAKRLVARFGNAAVGVVMPGVHGNPKARIQIGTVQTLLARGIPDGVQLLVLDEAHHYAAEDWNRVAQACIGARVLGLTATPERRDGEPLGDIFQELVIAAHYSELVRDGYLVPARVLQPPKNLGNDLAQDPLDAWAKHSEGSQTFAFAARVDLAYGFAKRFRDHGVLSDTIEYNTPRRERERIFDRFRSGALKVIWNVYALTEGVDVPESRTALLARQFGHVGGYLQAVGRVLRPAKNKPDAIVVDLCGATLRHGMPTDDRKYSLTGRAISGEPFGGGSGAPPDFTQEVKGLELRIAARGAMVSPAPMVVHPIPEEVRRDEFRRLLSLARQHRMRDGFASVKYREKYGEEPRREWR